MRRSRHVRISAVVFAVSVIIAHATAAPKVFVIGDSRTTGGVEGYAEYLPAAIGSAASCTPVRIDALVGELYGKIASFKGAAMVHFMGGLDDLTCISLMSQADQDKKYNTYIAEVGRVIDKMKTDLPGTVIVHVSMFKVSGQNGCSQKDERCPGCRRRDSDVQKFNAGSIAVAKQKKILTHDLYTLTKGLSQPDERHFDESGQAKIAKMVADFIKNNLSQSTTTHYSASLDHPKVGISNTSAGIRIVNNLGADLIVKSHSLRGELVKVLRVSAHDAKIVVPAPSQGTLIITFTSGHESWSVPIHNVYPGTAMERHL